MIESNQIVRFGEENLQQQSVKMYTIGQKVECVDTLGIWSLAVILNEVVVDQRWLVKFEGWGKKWNREVSGDEIRNITVETETCQRRKRKVSLFYLIMLVQIIKLT